MTLEMINIGSSPWGEKCAQVGEPDYSAQSIIECRVFIKQIGRVHGSLPDGAELRVKTFPHDFGSYREVVCYYDPTKPEAVEWAFKVEGSSKLEYWDDLAKDELHAFKTLPKWE